ncbi:MAG: hypothetical protein STSR0007_11700 [Thermovirga sp.]
MLVAFTPLVRYITREFAEVSRNEMEDLLQEGYISIISAVKGYESARGKFSSYTFSCVRNRMISFIRKNRNKLFLIPLSHETSGTITYPEMPDNCPHLEEELFRGLTCLEATVLDAFLETGSISGAALVLEWPRKRVDNALQRIRRKIVANRDL